MGKYETLDDWKRSSLVIESKQGKVFLMGWVDRIISSRGKSKIFLRDQSGVRKFHIKNIAKRNLIKLKKLTPESVIALKGKLREDSVLSLEEGGIKIFNLSHKPLPYSKNTLDIASIKMLPKRQFVIKSPNMTNILRLRSSVLSLIREFMQKENLVEFSSQTISLVTDPGVRTANLFTLPDYQRTNYVLSSSAQLYKQAALIPLDKAYTISPALRAEQTSSRVTGRHLSDFWELDVEMAFTNYNQIMNFAERMLRFIIKGIYKKNKKELNSLNSFPKIPKIPFKKISYDTAIELAKKRGIKTEKGEEISWEAEKIISEEFDQPFWVIDYPPTSRAWYYRRDLENPGIVRTMDLLYSKGFGEGITGGEREYDYKTLLGRIKSSGDDPKKYSWYFRFGD